MKCHSCHSADTKVIESRDVTDGESVRRRRECLVCKVRFTTYERIERPDLVVIKKDKTREMYDRKKLAAGLYRACEKTSVSGVQVERVVQDIENYLYSLDTNEIKTEAIGELIMTKLAKLNEVAYVRFASVYRRFKDIESFEKELSAFKKTKSS